LSQKEQKPGNQFNHEFIQPARGQWLQRVRLVVGRPGFDSFAESDQITLKNCIHSFPA